jgi:hypothetical protein
MAISIRWFDKQGVRRLQQKVLKIWVDVPIVCSAPTLPQGVCQCGGYKAKWSELKCPICQKPLPSLNDPSEEPKLPQWGISKRGDRVCHTSRPKNEKYMIIF